MFTGLSAFPTTPFRDEQVDVAGYSKLITRLCDAGVDSIGALGSTGSYAYLREADRVTATHAAVEAARGVPVLIGVGALSTREVLRHVATAEQAGAAGVLLAPLSYQPLTDDEVYGLFARVAEQSAVPIVVYDNPATTRVTFTDELYGRITQLPSVASVKIPSLPANHAEAAERMQRLRSVIRPDVTIGTSGDAAAAQAIAHGCDGWYSVLGGLLPEPCLDILRAARAGDASAGDRLSAIWSLFAQYGSYRVVSAMAEELGYATAEAVHHPVRPLDGAAREAVVTALKTAL